MFSNSRLCFKSNIKCMISMRNHNFDMCVLVQVRDALLYALCRTGNTSCVRPIEETTRRDRTVLPPTAFAGSAADGVAGKAPSEGRARLRLATHADVTRSATVRPEPCKRTPTIERRVHVV